jgi:protein required for attachment to host cells
LCLKCACIEQEYEQRIKEAHQRKRSENTSRTQEMADWARQERERLVAETARENTLRVEEAQRNKAEREATLAAEVEADYQRRQQQRQQIAATTADERTGVRTYSQPRYVPSLVARPMDGDEMKRWWNNGEQR